MQIHWRVWSAALFLLTITGSSTATIIPAQSASSRLQQALSNPEFMLKNWVDLPISPPADSKKTHNMTIREAILLALRYNPNIQNAELDRIIQRYQLRLAYNEFELQYALGGSAAVARSHYSGVGSSNNHSFLATPEVNLKTRSGGSLALNMSNDVSAFNSYAPVLNFSLRQPLLRGAGREVNEAGLNNALDSEFLNKISMQQNVVDQITDVITAYRSLITSGNNLQSQKRQRDEAHKTFSTNEKKIKAGQLEPSANVQQSYQIESLNLSLEQAQHDFKISEQNLLQTIGLDPAMRIKVPSDVEVGTIKIPDLQQSIALALAHNTQYLGVKMSVRADERAYTIARNQQLWQLDLQANVQSGTVTDVTGNNSGLRGIYNGQNTNESASLTVTIPIHDLNRRSQLISARIALEKDKLRLITARRALITAITNNITTAASQARRYQLAEKQVKLAQQSYELEKKKQQAGISSALDVNNTQNQLIQAQAGLIDAKIAYLNQLSALQRLLGTTLKEWHITLRYGI